MSKLASSLAKNKLGISDKTSKKKATDMITIEPEKELKDKIDLYLKNEEKIKDLETETKVLTKDIKAFAYEYVIKNHETENLILQGSKGEINVNFKDQYNDLNSENKDALEAFLVEKGVDPEKHITEESKVVFNFNKLNEAEQKKLMKFLSKEIGEERYSEVVETKIVFKIKDLKDTMIKKCQTVEDFQKFRAVASHHDATIAKRVTK